MPRLRWPSWRWITLRPDEPEDHQRIALSWRRSPPRLHDLALFGARPDLAQLTTDSGTPLQARTPHFSVDDTARTATASSPGRSATTRTGVNGSTTIAWQNPFDSCLRQKFINRVQFDGDDGRRRGTRSRASPATRRPRA
jgi:hypothetical protein